jgi:DNA-binding NarL/FixJ family response regulator
LLAQKALLQPGLDAQAERHESHSKQRQQGGYESGIIQVRRTALRRARFKDAVLDFMGMPARPEGEDQAFQSLSPREREILALLSEGLGNSEIAERLSISDKTVRNHVSNLFDKLGVWTRAQAIVFAGDRGFAAAPQSGARNRPV